TRVVAFENLNLSWLVLCKMPREKTFADVLADDVFVNLLLGNLGMTEKATSTGTSRKDERQQDYEIESVVFHGRVPFFSLLNYWLVRRVGRVFEAHGIASFPCAAGYRKPLGLEDSTHPTRLWCEDLTPGQKRSSLNQAAALLR